MVMKFVALIKSIEDIQQNFSEDDYLFPIPDNDVELGGLTQNPGY